MFTLSCLTGAGSDTWLRHWYVLTLCNVHTFVSLSVIRRRRRWRQLYSVSQKNPPHEIFWHFFPYGWEILVQILHAYYTFLSTLDYKFLFNYLQLWRRYAIFSATTIMCSKCPPSTETHDGWSHLIWQNFVRVGDKWIKICVIAYLWTLNRRVNFGLKIPNCLGKISENSSVRFSRWWTTCAHDVNWVVTLNMA